MEVSAALDRDAVRRVLRRATDLAGTEPVHLPDGGGIEPEALVAAAAEVGIPEDAVRRAITVEQLGVPPSTRGALLGPAVVVVDEELDGSADLALGEAVDTLRTAGHVELADRIQAELVGRNVLHGRWTFQIVEEYDDGYYAAFRSFEQAARDELLDGRRHVFEAEMKEDRRTHDRPGHEATPG